jgi:hypothetical protein
MKSATTKETTMKAIVTSIIVKLVAVAAVAAAVGALAGAHAADVSRASSAPRTASHKPSSPCEPRQTSRHRFVQVRLAAAAKRDVCRPRFVLV